MASETDPYRTLGLGRGATLAEVKRAYRQLAKVHHPDAAGEASLSRFLAIQQAYDRIVGLAGGGIGAGPGRGPTESGGPWRADPTRAGATHRAYGGRSRRTRQTGPRPAGGPAGTRTGEGTARSGPDGTGAGGGADSSAPGAGAPGAVRDAKKATMGSTSYDGADAEPFEPDWGGASWYGTTSGTYWTLNPKEYADPRKHGPEYQARARRAADAPVTTPPTHSTTSWWDATAADPGSAEAAAASEAQPVQRGDPAPRPTETPRGPQPAAWDAARFLDPASGGTVGRVGRGIAGWAPIAIGIAWLAGEISGCARFAATCDTSSAPIAWFVQAVLLAVLLLVPRLAVAASTAAIGTLAVAIPGALAVTSMGAAADLGSARTALGVLLVVGWLAGAALGLGREVRRSRVSANAPSDHGGGPVS